MAEVKKLTLSESTCRRCVGDISKNIFQAIIDKLKNCRYFYLACDTSTDTTSISSAHYLWGTAQLIVEEDFLAVLRVLSSRIWWHIYNLDSITSTLPHGCNISVLSLIFMAPANVGTKEDWTRRNASLIFIHNMLPWLKFIVQ